MSKLTPELIKKIVELHLDIDLTTKSRKIFFVFKRYLYYALCFHFLRKNKNEKFSLTSIANPLITYESTQIHARALHGFKKWNEVVSKKLEYQILFEQIKNYIENNKEIINDKIKDSKNIIETLEKYDSEIERHIEDNFKLNNRIKELQLEMVKNPYTDVINELKKLSKKDFNRFIETRLKPFIAMCKSELNNIEVNL